MMRIGAMRNKQEELAWFGEACRKAGLRLTPQRLEIFAELAEATDHPSAEELHQRLRSKFPPISLDTVYRTLGTFAQHGLVHKVETAESQGRFEVPKTRHHHLICRRCKEIVDFTWGAFDATELPDELTAWGRIENRNAVIYGICRTCQELL
jgi:Fur family transcriptional regulator, peroxide stress response regulator